MNALLHLGACALGILAAYVFYWQIRKRNPRLGYVDERTRERLEREKADELRGSEFYRTDYGHQPDPGVEWKRHRGKR